MAAKDIEVPEWLVPGAQVVVWTEGRNYGRGNPEARATTVTTVGKMWFSVDGLDDKIRIDRMRSKDFGSSWNHWRYRVVERDSDEGVQLLNRTYVDNAVHEARRASDAFDKNPRDTGTRAALRRALDKLDDAFLLLEGNGS